MEATVSLTELETSVNQKAQFLQRNYNNLSKSKFSSLTKELKQLRAQLSEMRTSFNGTQKQKLNIQ